MSALIDLRLVFHSETSSSKQAFGRFVRKYLQDWLRGFGTEVDRFVARGRLSYTRYCAFQLVYKQSVTQYLGSDTSLKNYGASRA